MGKFKKGWKGGPGRPPVLLPEVQSLIERDKNAVRVAILSLLNLTPQDFQIKSREARTVIERLLCQCIEKIETTGDVHSLKMLLEIPLGKIPEDKKPEELTDEDLRILQRAKEIMASKNAKVVT